MIVSVKYVGSRILPPLHNSGLTTVHRARGSPPKRGFPTVGYVLALLKSLCFNPFSDCHLQSDGRSVGLDKAMAPKVHGQISEQFCDWLRDGRLYDKPP